MFATYSRTFFKKEAPKFAIFSSVLFSGGIILKYIENKKALGGFGSMLPQNFFENSNTVGAILALFEQYLGKFCLNFLPQNLSVPPNMMHFVHTFSIMCAQGVRLIVIKKVRNYGKTVSKLWKNCIWRKTCLKMAVGGVHSPWIRPCLH